jgi:pilus assembly protein CpaB
MALRAALIVILLLGLIGFGGVAWMSLRPPEAERVEAPPPPARASFLLAARQLRAGSLVKPDDLKSEDLAVADAPEGARRDSVEARAELLGAMIRRALPPGDPLRADDVLRPGDRGFLAAVLGPNMRAVSVGVDAVAGAAGLIWPGDRVDVLLTQQMNDDTLPIARRVSGETVLSNVRVIAIDQMLMQGALGEGPEIGRQVRTVTLEVSSRQAERVGVAMRLGRLALLVRSAEETTPVAEMVAAPPAPPVTWGGDVSQALRGGPSDPVAAPQTIQIFQGATRREEFRF